jgi:hypothetical protein
MIVLAFCDCISPRGATASIASSFRVSSDCVSETARRAATGGLCARRPVGHPPSPRSLLSPSGSAAGGRTIPAPVSPSLQPLRRLLALPSGEVGPRECRPLARLASARAVLGYMLVILMSLVGSASAVDMAGSSREASTGSTFIFGAVPRRAPDAGLFAGSRCVRRVT